MATVLDPPAAPPTEQPPALGSPGAPSSPQSETPEVSQRTCANCGAAMNADQDWCLQCGASAPGSLVAGAPSWRSAALVLGATVVLALGAAAAAYAAWGGAGNARRAVVSVAQAPAPPTATPVTPLTTTTPNASKALGAPKAAKSVLPKTPVKPPKIPLTAAVPKSSTTTTPSSSRSTSTQPTTTPKTTSTAGATTTTETQPTPIALDTNAAATYNPYDYPASNFGDPSLAIDGDTSTGWTAQVNPAVAPRMAEGLVIDLKTAQKLSTLVLVTSTPGMTVQVYGSNGKAVPASITDQAWIKLSPSELVKSKHITIKLRDSTKAFRFVTLWISDAPTSSIGTAQAPGHVSVNELELFPAT